MKFQKKKLFSIVNYIVLVPLVFLIILFIGSVLPIPGNYEVKTVLSGSMEPAIKVGSVVVVKPMDNYKIGDIITFKTSPSMKTPITHRIVEMEVIEGSPLYTTQGDANDTPDNRRVYEGQVEGRVILSIQFLGFAIDFVRKPIGFLLIIILPAGIIVLGEGRKIFKELKKKKNDEKQKKESRTDNVNIKDE